MDDLISRRDLRLMQTEECAGHTIEYAMGWKACIDWIKTLPSVTPISKETNKEIGKDFVDCEDATIQILSELRAEYSCFDEKEEPVYRALSEAIKTLRLVNNSQELDKNFGESEDAISRQAAIDALQKLTFKHYMECGEYIGEDTKIVQLINSENAINAIINLPSVTPQRWIPCSERLPEKFQTCIVTDEYQQCAYEYDYNPENEFTKIYGWRYNGRKIIAWMPLPTPYKADIRGEEQCF